MSCTKKIIKKANNNFHNETYFSQPAENEETIPKRGRGRPKKTAQVVSSGPISLSSQANTAGSLIPTKKSPGRPRKKVQAVSSDFDLDVIFPFDDDFFVDNASFTKPDVSVQE